MVPRHARTTRAAIGPARRRASGQRLSTRRRRCAWRRKPSTSRRRRCSGLKARTGEAFARAVEQMLCVRGRVVVMGMGKSGHIGRKIAATLASTGTPAMFVHPAEASHGDLGMIKPVDLVLAISNGGESDEMTVILPVLKRLGVPLVAMTGGLRLDAGAATPTSCWTAASRRKPARSTWRPRPAPRRSSRWATRWRWRCSMRAAFAAEDFARSHPGGALGRKLLTHLGDVMRTGDAGAARGPRHHVQRPDARDERQGPGRLGRGRRRGPGAGHLHRRRPAPPGRKGHGPARPHGARGHAPAARAPSAAMRWRWRRPS